jgi:hypothetical protein
MIGKFEAEQVPAEAHGQGKPVVAAERVWSDRAERRIVRRAPTVRLMGQHTILNRSQHCRGSYRIDALDQQSGREPADAATLNTSPQAKRTQQPHRQATQKVRRPQNVFAVAL